MSDEHRPIEVNASARLTLTGSAAASVRTNLSFQHIRSAAYLAGECADLEPGNAFPAPEPITIRHTAAAMGAVISSVCAIEASINEFHLDALDRNEGRLGRAGASATLVEQLWDTVERQSILRKYQWVLSLARCEPFVRGEQPYQAAADLIELRDALVHFKPEWSHTPQRNENLERRLGGKFPLNPMAAPGQFFIPYRCLGAGCARSAVRGALAFIDSFYERLGTTPPLKQFESMILPLVRGSTA
jgi:hypothetical protein